MKKSKPLQVYHTDEERVRIEFIRDAFGEKTISSTYKKLALMFYNLRNTPVLEERSKEE